MEIPKTDWIKELEAAANKFWKEEYPQKSQAEKCAYWEKVMAKGMEEQEKMGQAPYLFFHSAWYASVKEQEPDIDNILKQLFETTWKTRDQAAFWAATALAPEEEEE